MAARKLMCRGYPTMAYPYFGITPSSTITEIPVANLRCGPCYANLMQPVQYTTAWPLNKGKFFFALIRYDPDYLTAAQMDTFFDIIEAITPERIKQHSIKERITQEQFIAFLEAGVKDGNLMRESFVGEQLFLYKYGEYGYNITPGQGDEGYAIMYYDREKVSLEDMYSQLAFIRIAQENCTLLVQFFKDFVPKNQGAGELDTNKLVTLFTAWCLTQGNFNGGHHVFGKNCLDADQSMWPVQWQGFKLKDQWTEHVPHEVPFILQTKKTFVQHSFIPAYTRSKKVPLVPYSDAWYAFDEQMRKNAAKAVLITAQEIMTVLQQPEAKAA